ncbi:glucosaminidase domain-containing protein [uncultured Polaribacter sp.]|uniref:glucosaminidase domain-containing protein n=1 Tax=uncultured Polaribacter sp. TaxID=174711 RepID=UPI002601D1D2|nr:glucosaminidase domain-containing protein [uncultured Polaribacter sp.]
MRLKSVFYIVFLLFLASCGSKKKAIKTKNTGGEIVKHKPLNSPDIKAIVLTEKLAKNNSNLNLETLAYIRKYAAIAVQEMQDYKIPASITLAQGILESGKGKSELALKSNNHFGIKCHSGWQGKRVYHDDDEKGECFRKYKHPETSYKDHSLFLSQRRRYAFLFNYQITDYKKWAYGLKKAGYATDKKYPVKLIKIIEDYQLYQFDTANNETFKHDLENRNTITKPAVIVKNNYHTVQKGETLYAISRKYNISINLLKQINNLKNNDIAIGQKLLIKNE